MLGCLAKAFLVLFVIGLFLEYPILLLIFLSPVILIIIYMIYEYYYFKSDEFLQLKIGISEYIEECNDLNNHIEELRNTDKFYSKKDYGEAEVIDTSNYDYKRKDMDKFSNSKHVYNCSLNICRAAQNKPFDYVSKYFNIPKNEESLEYFESMLNNFISVEEGRVFLEEKKENILESMEDKVPKLIRSLSEEKLTEKLGFEEIDFSDIHFPTYKLQYISAGGNSSMETEVELNINNLERFIKYLDEHIKWRQSVRGQRALMTPSLRQKIKNRDNFTCCNCGNSTYNEPNLLLEIDHIKPLAKGGMTKEDNLQTLCWKCNRSKGANIVNKKGENYENRNQKAQLKEKHKGIYNSQSQKKN